MEMFKLLIVATFVLASLVGVNCQRKVSRNERTGGDGGSEVKTVVNFNCPEEFGYYPHPSDCTQYYVCVFGGALLESCTGGLMYSHELQTCDWPRNVGCDGVELSASITPAISNQPSRTREDTKARYVSSTAPPAQPAAVVTSRGQPRQLHHNQQEIIKQRQQQQLYADAEENLPPAEEVENDRQQRVYRGQPSTVGQVQRDRDGLRHSNAIPTYSGRDEKIGVISFGTQQQYSFIDDIVDNDLTLKRTRRQTQRSRIRSIETTWRGGQNFQTSKLNVGPYTLQPPTFAATFRKTTFVPSHFDNDQDGFKPFVPKHTNVPIHIVTTNERFEPLSSIPSNRYSVVITPSATPRSVTDGWKDPNKIKHSLTYYNDDKNLMFPQYTHINQQNISSVEISNPAIKITTTIAPESKESLKEEDTSVADYPEFNEHYGPPPSYFNTKNKYEDIENPFADPNFDFDKFLANLRPDSYEEKSQSKTVTVRPKPKIVPRTKPPQHDYDEEIDGEKPQFKTVTVKPKSKIPTRINPPTSKPSQHDYYEDIDETNQAAKKIYSSQIKPTTKEVQKPSNDYYFYDDDYDYPQKTEIKPVNVSKNGEEKYSAKYQGKPKVSKIVPRISKTTTTTLRPSNKKIISSESYVSPYTIITTTQRPKFTTRRSKTTIPTTRLTRSKQRQRLDNYKRTRVEQSSATPVQPSISTARTLYNSSQYNNNNSYEPYYALYDDDVELYRDVDYTQQYNNNNAAQSQNAQQSYRRPSSDTQTEAPKRGNAAYVQNSYSSQDLYQPSSDYNEDNSYSSQVDDQNSYRQLNRQPTRGDRNDLNYLEETSTKRTTTTRKTTTTTTRTTTSRTTHPKKSTVPRKPVTANENKTQAQFIINTLQENPGPHPLTPHTIISHLDETTGPNSSDTKIRSEPVTYKPTPFTRPEHLTTEKPIIFHYITKPSRSTTLVSMESSNENRTVIAPTTYSPPKFVLKSLLPKTQIVNNTLKSVRKTINPINVNYELSSIISSTFESAERLAYNEKIPKATKSKNDTKSLNPDPEVIPQRTDYNDFNIRVKSIKPHEDSFNLKRFRTTIEIPQFHDLIDDDEPPKPEPDQPPTYKLSSLPRPISSTTTKTTTIKTTVTDSSQNTTIPTRVSRVNTAIKSLIAFGGTRRQNLKCHENADSKCNDRIQQRTSTRGRGSSHYTNGGGNLVNNEVTVTVNRGTPASRPRPTLKPSTSIVSKASEFIDIYRYPPIRPEAIYPQPQPDKTAAKCRKDVCLLPDCSCGGKEIPGDLPVEQVPQLVLLTFDDSVNDLNKGLYSDLFEKDRVNPNGCPIAATFYVSHEWTDYSQVQNLYSDGHEIASHTVSHSFGEQFSQKKWTREVAGQREILSAYGGVHLEDVRGMRAPFLSVGGNKMFKMLYDSNFTYDSSMPIYENKPPSWPYTLDYKLFHDCMIPPCPTRSYPGVWEVPMVMWQDLNGGRCSMGDACSNPPDADGVFKLLTKNFQRHYTTNRAPFGLFYHAAWFTQPHHKEGFVNFLDSILQMKDVWLVTNWQALQWVRDPTPASRLGTFQPFQCDFSNRPKRCNNPKVCNLWHKSGVRYMRTCQPCPDIYPWTGNSGIRSSRIDNDIED